MTREWKVGEMARAWLGPDFTRDCYILSIDDGIAYVRFVKAHGGGTGYVRLEDLS